MVKRIRLLSLALLVAGFGCGYAVGHNVFGYVLFHLGGLGSLGLLASGVGCIARKKGYGYWRVFLFAFSSSVLLGTAGAFLVPPVGAEGRPAACGGSVSLLVAVVFIVVWAIKRKRVGSAPDPGNEG